MSEHDPLRPRSPGGLGAGAVLAILIHVVLLLALAFGVNWRAREPEGVSAELWAAVPQQAAPREEAPPPKPEPKPEPKPQPQPPKPESKPEPEPPKPDPKIAIEQERQRKAKLEKERQEQEEKEREKEREKEKEAARKKQEAEAQRKKEQEEKRMAQVLEKQRQDQIRRIQGLAGATGGPTDTGNAQRSAGPSSSYAGRVKAKVKPNILFSDDLPSNPTAEVEVRAGPDGTILGRRLVKSSGVKEWDDAVLRAIDRTEVLPKDVDGRVPSPMVLVFKPRE